MPKIIDVKPLVIKGRKELKLDSLNYQFVPIVTPIKLWNYDMALKTSPHVELMRLFLDHGLDWEKIEETRYFKERVRRHDLGLRQWTTTRIKEHVQRRYAILRSLKRAGYRKKLYRDKPVSILKKPFWSTRFEYKKDFLTGKEIWDGGGRCAAAYALGWETIPIVYYCDVSPGSKTKGKFSSKLENVKGVWDETFGVYNHSVL